MIARLSLLIVGFVLPMSFSFFAMADTIDRINDCERAGGGSCLFQILRELALKSDGDHGPKQYKHFCECINYSGVSVAAFHMTLKLSTGEKTQGAIAGGPWNMSRIKECEDFVKTDPVCTPYLK